MGTAAPQVLEVDDECVRAPLREQTPGRRGGPGRREEQQSLGVRGSAPDRPLNPWFVEIVALGTGHEFTPEHNSRWTEVTRATHPPPPDPGE